MATPFWVIFDTSTKEAYYQDVHNLLAFPSNTIIRYDYKGVYISDEARKVALSEELPFRKVLLVYAQWSQYKKGDSSPKPPPPENEMIFVATRLAEMQPIVVDGATFIFDLKLGGYPAHSEKILKEILDPLLAKKETPYYKWVSVSNQEKSLNLMSVGSEEHNWQKIVDLLGIPPSQFVGDSFWRLKGLIYTTTGLRIKPRYDTEVEMKADEKVIRRTYSYFDLIEGSVYSTDIASYTPRPTTNSVATGSRLVKLTVEPADFILITSGTDIPLRSSTQQLIRFNVLPTQTIDSHDCMLTLLTENDPGKWPIGPKFSIQFRINKNRIQLILALFCSILGVTAGIVATQISKSNSTLSLLFAVLSVVLILVAVLLYSRKLLFKF
jgi:hypothetical protein